MSTSSSDAIRSEIEALGPWFHNLHLPGGVQTAPGHQYGDFPRFKWEQLAHAIPKDLSGWSVLDIGCNAGFYSMEMKRRGAERVVAIDSDEHYLRQARFAANVAGLDIEFRRMSVYDIGKLGEKFDLVIFMGVLYHLRHPLLALDMIYEHVARDMMLFQCMQRGSGRVPELKEDYPFSEWEIFEDTDFPKLFFVEERYASDPTNWFVPNRAAVEAMLRSSGFVIAEQPEREVYLCRKGQRHYAVEKPPL